MNIVAITAHGGIRLAEVGFLLVGFAGVWLVAAQIPQLRLGADGCRWCSARNRALLLIIATHWGHFG